MEWKVIDNGTKLPAIVCNFEDDDHDWLPMTAYRIGDKWVRAASRDGLPYVPTHYIGLDELPNPPSKP